MTTSVSLEKICGGQVGKLVLKQPPGNILDSKMVKEIVDQVETLSVDKQVKAIAFEGGGKNFSYGASIQEHMPEQVSSFLKGFHHLFYKLGEIDLPTVALVRGKCLGGGLELAAMCSLIVSTEEAEFGLPEIKLGVFPPLGSILLPRRVGQSHASELILGGDLISAKEAHRIGLVSQVWSNENFEEKAESYLLRTLCSKSRVALRLTNQASRQELLRVLKQDLPRLEALYLGELMNTHDAKEGVAAFLEKRPPRWINA